MTSDYWSSLEIEPTKDIKLIKKQYASLIKEHRPEVEPDKFKQIRQAYEKAIYYANSSDIILEEENDQLKEEAQLITFSNSLTLDEIYHKFVDFFSKPETRNDLEKLHNLWFEHQLDIEQTYEFARNIFDYLLYFNYFRNVEDKLCADAFIFLIDHLIPECTEEFLLIYFNPGIVSMFLQEINARRQEIRIGQLTTLKNSNFNMELQILVEDLFNEKVADCLYKDCKQLYMSLVCFEASVYIKTKTIDNLPLLDHTKKFVLGNVVFEFLLNKLKNFTYQISKENIYIIYSFFNFKKRESKLLEQITPGSEYTEEDILQLLRYMEFISSSLSIIEKLKIMWHTDSFVDAFMKNMFFPVLYYLIGSIMVICFIISLVVSLNH